MGTVKPMSRHYTRKYPKPETLYLDPFGLIGAPS